MFPIVMLATIYFVRATLDDKGFRSFVVYSHCAIVATAMFVIVLYFSLAHVSIAPALAIGLLFSMATSFAISRVWRARPAHDLGCRLQ
jgi:hypothetical protein